MNDETNPDPIDTPADPGIVDALRSTPDDLDEIFARRAIATALGSHPIGAMAPEPEDDVSPVVRRRKVKGRTQRRPGWRNGPWIGAAAALLLVVVVAVTTFRSVGKDSLASGHAASEASEAADHYATSSQKSAQSNRADGSHGAGDDASNSESAGSDILPYLGDFDDATALVSLIDGLGENGAIEIDGSGASPGTRQTEGVDSIPASGTPLEDIVSDCAEELRGNGYGILGWARIDQQPVIVASEPSLGQTRVLDATTCTA